jgi:Mn-dependent DtxR family transcriptional regulator
MTNKEQKLAEAMIKSGKAMTAKQISARFGLASPSAAISRMIKSGIVVQKTYTNKKVGKTVTRTVKYQVA